MGLLVRQEDSKWLMEIREKWYFDNPESASNVQLSLMGLGVPFTTGIEGIKGKKYFTTDIIDQKIHLSDLEELKTVFENICRLKEKYGQRPEWP